MLNIISLMPSYNGPMLWPVAVFLVSVISYFLIGPRSSPENTSSKEERSRALRQAFNEIESREAKEKGIISQDDTYTPSGSLTISKLWIYPIKSLRGCEVPHAMLTKEGFYHDRRFMLLKVDKSTPLGLRNMHIPHFPKMSLFHPSIEGDRLLVRYRAPGTTEPATEALEIPLHPEDLDSLEKLLIRMHSSPTIAYHMGSKCSEWFSERFGFKVILAYWGGNPRPVLGNLPPENSGATPSAAKPCFLKTICQLPILRSLIPSQPPASDSILAFSDCAAYLVISEKSVADVTARLPPGMEMDHTKFRPNIVIRGASSAYEEDFWGELAVARDGGGDAAADIKIILTANCARCSSINVDFNTGAPGKGKDGQIFKLLQRDRRVDKGAKWSPIFGRYGFGSKGSEGGVLRVGDRVVVSRRNEERTTLYWPGISTP